MGPPITITMGPPITIAITLVVLNFMMLVTTFNQRVLTMSIHRIAVLLLLFSVTGGVLGS